MSVQWSKELISISLLHYSGVGAILVSNFPCRCVCRDLIPSFCHDFQSSPEGPWVPRCED